MENTEQQTSPTPEQIEAAQNKWLKESLDKAQKHLAQKGIIPKSILDKESRYIVPLCAVWKIKSQQGKTFWVVSGDLPTDHIEVTAAPNAREAIKYFSLHWQMKADEIIKSGVRDKTQADFANLLINRAHGLYDLSEKDDLWTNEPA